MFVLQNAPLPTLRARGLDAGAPRHGERDGEVRPHPLRHRGRARRPPAPDRVRHRPLRRRDDRPDARPPARPCSRSIVAEPDRPVGSLPMLTEEERRHLLGHVRRPRGGRPLRRGASTSLLTRLRPPEGSPMSTREPRGGPSSAPASARPRSVAAMPAVRLRPPPLRSAGRADARGDRADLRRSGPHLSRAGRAGQSAGPPPPRPGRRPGVPRRRLRSTARRTWSSACSACSRRAGPTFPLDPAYPADRLAFMLDDAGAGGPAHPSGPPRPSVSARSPVRLRRSRRRCHRRAAGDEARGRRDARQPGLRHLHVRLHRPAQGGDDRPPRPVELPGLGRAGLPGCRGDRGRRSIPRSRST